MAGDRKHFARPYLWALGILWGLPALGVLVGYLLLPKDNASGQCEGIGFGCTPSPADSVILLGMLAAPWLAFAGAAAAVVISLVRGRRAGGRDVRS